MDFYFQSEGFLLILRLSALQLGDKKVTLNHLDEDF